MYNPYISIMYMSINSQNACLHVIGRDLMARHFSLPYCIIHMYYTRLDENNVIEMQIVRTTSSFYNLVTSLIICYIQHVLVRTLCGQLGPIWPNIYIRLPRKMIHLKNTSPQHRPQHHNTPAMLGEYMRWTVLTLTQLIISGKGS